MSNSSFIKSRPCITAHFRSYITSLVALELNCFASEIAIDSIFFYNSSETIRVHYFFHGKKNVFEYNFEPFTCSPLNIS